jgi:hypothetical protein
MSKKHDPKMGQVPQDKKSPEHHQLLPFQQTTTPEDPTKNVNCSNVLTTAAFVQWSNFVVK